MTDKHAIVPLKNPRFPKKNKTNSNALMLSLKNKDLELNFYSSLDPDVMNKILNQVLS